MRNKLAELDAMSPKDLRWCAFNLWRKSEQIEGSAGEWRAKALNAEEAKDKAETDITTLCACIDRPDFLQVARAVLFGIMPSDDCKAEHADVPF
jgi:hypothetical protein